MIELDVNGLTNSERLIEPHRLDGAKPATLRFWEIESHFKCPVVGLCLTLFEQKHLLKKAGISWKKKSPFEIHEIFASNADNENRLSRKVDALLTHKYGRQTQSLHQMTEQAFMEHWRASFESGEHIAVLWAAACRADLSAEARKEIFGAVHMSMHATGETLVKANKRCSRLQRDLDGQFQKVDAIKKAHRELQKENKQLKRERTAAEAKLRSIAGENDELQATIDRLSGSAALVAENRHLKRELSQKSARIDFIEHELKRIADRAAVLSDELDLQRKRNTQLQAEVREALRSTIVCNPCDESCPAFDLCRKRVLIVGGFARMESLYRQLIEGGGGMLDYHNGVIKGGSRQLENYLKRADIVLCPVNCNSHAACSIVKRLGRKHKKPVHMMANFSLNAITQVLGGNGSSQQAPN